jgi:2'-5' RNA ligase
VLIQFQNQLEASLEKVGFQTEGRSFHPHLTLGRVRSSHGKGALAAKIEKYREEDVGTFQVERVTLFQSDLKPSGPVYTPLKELPLGR